jgi:hypothetical protein
MTETTGQTVERDPETRIYRYEVPVDDRWHEIELCGGEPEHVAARRYDVVEFWAYHDARFPARKTRFMAVGTGHPLPRGAAYVGTALAADGRFVWHLFEDRS